MANWSCSVFNVVCVVNVCPVHAVDLNELTLGCYRPWTKMHKKTKKKRQATILIWETNLLVNWTAFRVQQIISKLSGKKFRASANDEDSKLATNLRINPQLVSPISKQELLEVERILVIRYRTRSHSLALETGRYMSDYDARTYQVVLQIYTMCLKDKNVYKNLLVINRNLKLPLDL